MHHQHAAGWLADGLDGFELAITKISRRVAGAHTQELECTGASENVACHQSLEVELPGVVCPNRCATTTLAMACTVGVMP